MAENQDEINNETKYDLSKETVETGFVREDLKHVAKTTSIFDSQRVLTEITSSIDYSAPEDASEQTVKKYTGRKYNFFLKNNAHTFHDVDSSDGPSELYSEDPIENHYVVTVNNGKNKGVDKFKKKQKEREENRDNSEYVEQTDTENPGISPDTSVDVWQSDYRKIFNRLIKNYPSDNMPQIQEFFTRFANALMFELSKKQSNIEAYGRIKSQYSFLGKCFYRASAHNQKPINDLFGLKLVIKSTDEVLPINHPLMKQKLENNNYIVEFQTTVTRLKKLESSKDSSYIDLDDPEPRLKVSEYYTKFIELLDHVKGVISPKATEYRKFIEQKKQFIQKKLDNITALGLTDVDMTEADLKIDDEFKLFYDTAREYSSDFEAVLAKYRELNNDLIDFPVLLNQVNDVFANSKILKKFGVSIAKSESKENEKGYKAQFIVLDTPVGRMEIQLQTDNQLREGKTGFNAHDKFKSIPPLPVIPPRGDKDKWDDFIDAVDFISPFSFTVEDAHESNESTMKTTYDSRYFSLKKVVEVSKESPVYSLVNKYLSGTYKLLNVGAKPQESMQITDIVDYLTSSSFKQLTQPQAPAAPGIASTDKDHDDR